MHAGATAKRREWFHYYLSHHSVPCWPLSVFVSFWNPVSASTPKRLWEEFGTWANDSWRHAGQRFLLPTRFVFEGLGRALHQESNIDLDGRGKKKRIWNVNILFVIVTCELSTPPFLLLPASFFVQAFNRIHVHFISILQQREGTEVGWTEASTQCPLASSACSRDHRAAVGSQRA